MTINGQMYFINCLICFSVNFSSESLRVEHLTWTQIKKAGRIFKKPDLKFNLITRFGKRPQKVKLRYFCTISTKNGSYLGGRCMHIKYCAMF